jgi:hypothetical protein
MSGIKLRTALLLGVAALLSASPAEAQAARDPVMADALFKSAKALLQQDDWPGACARFEASMKLDPAVSTALKIARCHEHEGKLAVAWNDVTAAIQLNAEIGQPEARRKELEAYARTFLVALETRMPRVRVRVADAPKGLALVCDGRPLPVEALGDALPVDPVSAAGEYCRPDFSACADPRGITLLGEARGLQTAALVLLGAGAAAAGMGVALFATAPRASSASAPTPEISATISPLGLSVRGAW